LIPQKTSRHLDFAFSEVLQAVVYFNIISALFSHTVRSFTDRAFKMSIKAGTRVHTVTPALRRDSRRTMDLRPGWAT
jgi:hypothetical protein